MIAINDDIDPENMDAVWWAMSYRCNPELDVQILQAPRPGPRAAQRAQRRRGRLDPVRCDAEGGLPADLAADQAVHGEGASKIWEELGLPELKPQTPWYGYSLGDWDEAFQVQAERAVKGDYWITGDIIAQQRRNDVPMNTEIGRSGKHKKGH